MSESVYRFGRFELRPLARELRADAQIQRIGERAFDILLALAEAEGRPLTRDELFEHAWPGRAVLDDNLKVQVMALRRLLGADVVLTVPGHGYRLGLPVHAVPATAGGDTPALPALFGRAGDLQRLQATLAPGRLVSLVGPGGIGKTRLALAAAQAAASTFADGHVVVELAPLADPGTLPATVARALALPAGAGDAALLAALRPLELLLVLDNAEHLRAAVAALAQSILQAAPRIALLATSQEALGLDGEQVLRLDGLATPADDSAAAVDASPAAQLFVARARAADPAFEADAGRAPEQTAALARICRRLDGIPLALELAAARVPLLGFAGVEDKLGEPLALLRRGARDAPPRQQTLRAALEWSHGLLNDAQQAVFRRLAVFAGSFGLEAAQQVAAGDGLDGWAVLDELQSLVEKSLVQRHAVGDTPRLRLLESARQFALEQLAAAGETAATRRRHAEATAALFEAADARYTASPTLPWLHALLPELPNLRAAIEWSLSDGGDHVVGIRLCAAAGGFWALTGLHAESAAPLRQLAPRVDDARVPLRARAAFWLTVANRGADYAFTWAETYEAAERAVALAREGRFNDLLHRALGHRMPLAQRVGAPVDAAATAAEMRALEGDDWSALQRRGRRSCEAFEWYQRGEWERFGAAERQELRLLREAGDLYRAWFAAHRLALAQTALGRPGDAVEVLQQAVDEIREAGLQRHCWQQVAMLAMALIETGHAPAAPVHEAVRLMRGARAMAWIGCHLAEWLAQQRRWDDAARLLGWVARRHAERGETATGHGERARDRAMAALQAAATPAQLAAWQAEGERWVDDDDAAAALLAAPGPGA